MSKVVVHNVAVSIDGYSAGLDQDINNPLGVNGPDLMAAFFETKTFHKQHGLEGGEEGIDDDFAAKSMSGKGAWILGRNMFGPIRGPWPNDDWKGWWGDEPPYHTPVFVLTHHRRSPLVMAGGTTFHFVTGIHAALKNAVDAAGGRDVRLGGGVTTIRQYLHARLVDEMHVAVAPALLGSGEQLFAATNLLELGYECREHVTTANVSHFVVTKTAS